MNINTAERLKNINYCQVTNY